MGESTCPAASKQGVGPIRTTQLIFSPSVSTSTQILQAVLSYCGVLIEYSVPLLPKGRAKRLGTMNDHGHSHGGQATIKHLATLFVTRRRQPSASPMVNCELL
jgi:hypothetical protein